MVMLPSIIPQSTRCVRPGFRAATLFLRGAPRSVSTLPDNPHIYVHKHPIDPDSSLLSLLPTEPPNQKLAIGTCKSLPPSPRNFTANSDFLTILSSVYRQYATTDLDVQQQASVFASPGGSFLGASPHSDGSGGANQQGSAGGAGHGGWIHVSDLRNPPDYGRIAFPEDIIGSVEVDGNGKFADNGNWQDSGTYRVLTRDGILGLTDYMRGRLEQRLREIEKDMQSAQ